MPSLHEIERTMRLLWLDRDAQEWLNSDASLAEAPQVVAGLNPEILAEVNRAGAALYARSIRYEHQDMADCIFPFCAKAIGKDWDLIASNYYKLYPSSHFNFNKICAQFSEYLKVHCGDLVEKYPYLPELADYEYLELEKAEDERKIERSPYLEINSLAQITEFFPVVNQTLKLCRYNYPIAEIAANFEKAKRPRKKFKAKPTNIAIYRDPDSHRTRFMELGNAIASIVETAQQKPTIYQDLLKLTISLTPELDPGQAALEFLSLVEELHKDNIFVGSKNKGELNGN